MALIVEDGSGVTGANTYASVAALREYASLRAITLPVDDPSCEVLLIKAMDYLGSVVGWQGVKTYPTSLLDFPRYEKYPFGSTTGIVVDGETLLPTTIPTILIQAQIILAVEAIKTDLQPNQMPSDKGAVTLAKAGEVQVDYAAPLAQNIRTKPLFAKVDALISKLLGSGGSKVIYVNRV